MNPVNIEEIASDEDLEFFPHEVEKKAPFFSDEKKRFLLTVIYSPVYTFFWLLSGIVLAFTRIVTFIKVRVKPYDPEKLVCPGCGYKGERGSDGKTCWIYHVSFDEPKRGMNKHTCFRCSAIFYTDLFSPGKDWLAPVVDPRIARMQQERTRVI